MTNKQELRKKYRTYDKSYCSKSVLYKLMQTKEYKLAKNIMIFYPLEKEVNLLELLNDVSKKFYLPKINENELLCCPYCLGDVLCKSKFKTFEPVSEPCNKADIDLVIVPALLCDKNNYRLGYGGGFYDRFLSDYRGLKICCIPHELVIDSIYPNSYDVRMDCIITD